MTLRKRHKFTTISNTALLDQRLSYKAKGLLVMLLSRPDGWTFRVDWLVKQSNDGITAVRSGLKELEDYGYLKRLPRRANGHLEGWQWFVTDEPRDDGSDLPNETECGTIAESFDSPAVLQETCPSGNLSFRKPEGQETCSSENPEDINNTELTNTDLTNTEWRADPILQRKSAFRANATLEETIFRTIGTELTIKLREIQEISGRRGTAWFGWLREHVAPHMQRLGSEFPGAVAAAVRAFHGSSDPRRWGLQDFVKCLEAYTPSPKPKPTPDEQLAAILADI